MSFFRRFTLLFILLAVNLFQSVHAQNTPKTLLWRISGKGLKQPSYLFGTMHLSDKRLFRFDDSVYRALEQVQGMAIEINPDEMVAYYVNKMFDETDKSMSLRDMLGEDSYNKYSKALEKKFNKPADRITTRDVFKEKNKWVSDYVTRGQMPTFVDAYLYNVARRQGKWVGGIEDLADQTSLMDELVDKSDIDILTASEKKEKSVTVEDLINLYRAQDLDAIDEAINNSSGIDRYNLLTRRNIKMARRMDSLSRLRTMFFAVGAAHLPGDSGVIALLRTRGFTVTPVFSATKTAADNYKFKEVPLSWYDVQDDQELYSVKMPGNPASVKMYGLIDTKILFDIFNMNAYMVMTVVSTATNEDPNATYDRMAESMTGRKGRYEKVMAGKVSGREYVTNKGGSQIRVRLFVDDNVTYMVMISGMKKEGLFNADAERYFESFHINKRDAPKYVVAGPKTDDAGTTGTTTATTGTAFVNERMAISVPTTVRLTESKALSSDENGMHIETYTGSDARNKAYILLLYKEPLPGYFIENDSNTLADLDAAAKTKYGGTRLPYHIGNYKGVARKGEKDNTSIDVRMLVRGNKTYLMVVVTDAARGNVFEDMFSGVKLLPYQASNFSRQSAADGSFTITAPSAPITGSKKRKVEASSDLPYFVTYDSATSTTYAVSTDTLKQFYWVNSDSAFWNPRLRSFASADNKIISEKKVMNGKDEGREWLFTLPGSSMYSRLRVVRHGNVVYSLYCCSEKAVTTGDKSDLFFNSFSITLPPSTYSIMQPKTDQLIAALKSKDSTTQSAAANALVNNTFTRRDLPALHKALYETYGNEAGYDINETVAIALASLGDTSTVQYIIRQYPTFRPVDTMKRNVSLSLLAKIHTKASYNAMATLPKRYPGPISYYYYPRVELLEHPELAQQSGAELLKLAGDRDLGLMIATVADSMQTNEKWQRRDMLPVEPEFLELARITAADTGLSTDRFIDVISLINVLGRYDDIRSPEAIRPFLKHINPWVAKNAVLTLLKKGAEVDQEAIYRLAADSTISYEFYKDLKEIGKKELFPRELKSQRLFATWQIYTAASGDDAIPDKIRFLMQKTGKYRGKQYLFYLYRITYGDDENATRYLGVAGGFDTEGIKLAPLDEADISGIYTAEEYSKERLETLFKIFLSNAEEAADESSSTTSAE